MVPAVQDGLTEELVDLVQRLSPEAKDKLFNLLLDEQPEETGLGLQECLNTVVNNRLLAYQRGELETISAEESVRELDLAYRQRIDG